MFSVFCNLRFDTGFDFGKEFYHCFKIIFLRETVTKSKRVILITAGIGAQGWPHQNVPQWHITILNSSTLEMVSARTL